MKKKLCAVLSFVILICSLLPLSVNARSLPVGDMNHDGAVNNKDAVALFKRLSGSENGIGEDEGDLNGDSFFNNKDVITLFQYLNGSEIKLCAPERRRFVLGDILFIEPTGFFYATFYDPQTRQYEECIAGKGKYHIEIDDTKQMRRLKSNDYFALMGLFGLTYMKSDLIKYKVAGYNAEITTLYGYGGGATVNAFVAVIMTDKCDIVIYNAYTSDHAVIDELFASGVRLD